MKQYKTLITYQHNTLEESDKTLNPILDIIMEGTWDWSTKTGHVDRNPSWYRMLGYEVGIFLKDVFTWENIIHPDDYPRVMQHFEAYISGQTDKYEIEYRCKKADGSYLWIVDRGKITEWNDDGSVARMIGAHENIHDRKMFESELLSKNKLLQEGNATLQELLEEKNLELQKANEELEKKIEEIERISRTDALTQIANRRCFEEEIKKEVERAKRYKHPLSLAMFDIDFFKDVNDRYGHIVGDHILIELSSLIAKSLRVHDSIARWGGEEFTLLLPNTSLNVSISVIEKLRKLIKHTNFDQNISITCSFGLIEYDREESVEEFFKRADDALYKAKHSGRNTLIY
ncbi:sensor domain-containing diguanylate cyclase [Sulfurimonas sp. C5]|uniref:sensor domain-containing diguanylate cyclase n=1 Tax=Sulfurimonas sp. C5 TaxID=3036947 RepID=UPI0024583741|nr:sensor domain-containing diguanylate cyclase [Sulfurimonas sp. C5]MDH4943836.1 sensor domain-containing diguanylate cyclase [Sulfurimonas sp. C5]